MRSATDDEIRDAIAHLCRIGEDSTVERVGDQLRQQKLKADNTRISNLGKEVRETRRCELAKLAERQDAYRAAREAHHPRAVEVELLLAGAAIDIFGRLAEAEAQARQALAAQAEAVTGACRSQLEARDNAVSEERAVRTRREDELLAVRGELNAAQLEMATVQGDLEALRGGIAELATANQRVALLEQQVAGLSEALRLHEARATDAAAALERASSDYRQQTEELRGLRISTVEIERRAATAEARAVAAEESLAQVREEIRQARERRHTVRLERVKSGRPTARGNGGR